VRCTAPSNWTIYVQAQVNVKADYVAAAVPLAGGSPASGKAGGALRQHPGDGDSDEEEEEGTTTSAGKKGGKPQEPVLVEIRNELEMEQVGAVSAENKAAAALERVFVSTEIVEEQEEEEMAVDGE